MREGGPSKLAIKKQRLQYATDISVAILAKIITSHFRLWRTEVLEIIAIVLSPMYTIPSRKTLSKSLIPQLYESTQASVWERVQKATAVCLTTDSWTSRVTTSYMLITCHFIEELSMSCCLLDCFEFSDGHTLENLAEELLRVA
jgi:hypothetical protein